MSAVVLKPDPNAEEMALPAWFCLEILLLKKSHDLGVILSRKVLPSVICVTKLLDIVGNWCHVLGESTQKKTISSWQTIRYKSKKKAEQETKRTGKNVQQRN